MFLENDIPKTDKKFIFSRKSIIIAIGSLETPLRKVKEFILIIKLIFSRKSIIMAIGSLEIDSLKVNNLNRPK